MLCADSEVKFSKLIYSSAPTSIPNMKALAQIRFEISCKRDFQIMFSKGHNSERWHNLDMKKIWVSYFFMRNTYGPQREKMYLRTIF